MEETQRKEKLNELRKQKINPYPQEFTKTHSAKEILKNHKKIKQQVSVAGRIVTIRKMGKASFLNIQDQSGKIQIYLKKDILKNKYSIFKNLTDIGDIIGIKGKIFKTKVGEITVEAKDFQILAKSLKPLPEKFHGLTDTELRYRQRYLDLISNPEIKELFLKRTKIIKSIREYLDKNNFIEVETPILQNTYGGASAKPFKTYLNFLKKDVFLAISPELYLKRLVIGGYEKVYTICKNFRNEDIDTTHNPEFTMLEFYYAYANYEKLMKMTEELIPKLVKEINKDYKIKLGDKTINFKPPFKKVKFRDLVLKQSGIDIDKNRDFESLKKTIIKKNIQDINLKDAQHYGALMDELYKKICRPNIIQPTFLTHYPVEMIPLAKRNEKDPTKINSFQLLVKGAELVKAYDELNDPQDQRQRLEEQQKFLKKGDESAMPLDEDFLEALEVGLPPTAGYGLGIDRLIMTLTGNESIKEVIFFPFMK